MERHNVRVLQVLEERDLPNGRARRSFFVLQSDLLQRHQLPSDATTTFVHCSVGTLRERGGREREREREKERELNITILLCELAKRRT